MRLNNYLIDQVNACLLINFVLLALPIVAGYEERLGKFIQSKLQEFKESTQRALAPEMSRLKQRNATLLSDLDLKYR